MKKYLSLGGGVDSVATMLWLEDNGEEFEILFVNHKADYPHTYDYVKYLQSTGRQITIINAGSLIDYCKENNLFPFRNRKFCTDKFKLRPMSKIMTTPSICFIGIGYYEKQRINNFKPVKSGVFNVAPLIGLCWSRDQEIQFIKDHGLKVPNKSGCFICHNVSKKELKLMRINYPDLYNIRQDLYNNAIVNINKKNNGDLNSFI